MKRFVLDANVLASGSVDPHGESSPCLLYLNLTQFEAILCPELLEEVAETLSKPYFAAQVGDASEIVAGIREASTILDDPPKVEPILRDPEDDYLVALARDSRAEAIVTGDKDLLEHPGLEPAAITSREACERLGLLSTHST